MFGIFWTNLNILFYCQYYFEKWSSVMFIYIIPNLNAKSFRNWTTFNCLDMFDMFFFYDNIPFQYFTFKRCSELFRIWWFSMLRTMTGCIVVDCHSLACKILTNLLFLEMFLRCIHCNTTQHCSIVDERSVIAIFILLWRVMIRRKY